MAFNSDPASKAKLMRRSRAVSVQARGISMAVLYCATKKLVSTGHRCPSATRRRFPLGGGKSAEGARPRLFAAPAKAGAAPQTHAHPLNHPPRVQGRHDVGADGPPRPVAVAFARQGQTLAGSQAHNG